MAGTRGRSTRDLSAELAQDASQFDFFQAVRLLGLSAPRRGRTRAPLPATLRFRTPASLSFPPSALTRYRDNDSGHTLEVGFMGLTGPSGVLPLCYTELLIERRQQHKDHAMHDFLDLFSHRAIALFYGAWRKYRYWIGVEAGEQDGFTRNLLDLGGVGLSRLRAQMGEDAVLEENLFIYYAGLLSQKPLSATALAALVGGFFGVEASLSQFVGQWIDVPPDEQSRLGQARLGICAFAGARIWDRQTKLQLRLGPLRQARFNALLPGSSGQQALGALLQFALGHSLAVDVTLVLDRRDIPPPVLDASATVRLGCNGWLGAQATDPEDMRFCLLR